MPNCSVICCKKGSGTSNIQKDGVTFHKFPKQPEFRDAWKNFCNNNILWEPKRTSVICSTHFWRSDFKVFKDNSRRLEKDSIPSLIPDCICANHLLPDRKSYITVGDLTSAPVLLKSSGESFKQERNHSLTIVKSENTVGDNNSAPILLKSPESIKQEPNDLLTIEETNTVGDNSSTTVQTSEQQPIQWLEISIEKCNSKSNFQSPLTPRERKMQQRIVFQRAKIKRLHSQISYLKKKVEFLESR